MLADGSRILKVVAETVSSWASPGKELAFQLYTYLTVSY